MTLCLYSFSKYYSEDFTLINDSFEKLTLQMEKVKSSFQVVSTDTELIGVDNELKTNSFVANKTSVVYTLSEYLFDFPWKKFEESMKTETETLYRQKLIDGIQKYAYQEPLIPVNDSCTPPPLLNPKDIICSNFPEAFLSNKYETPVKVAHAIQLGFDADNLEIHLNEIYDVIDYFFILEATRIHCKILR